MTRATRAVINLAALRHNLAISRQHSPAAKQLAIIKANGYGHGIEHVARELYEADAFGVACIDEAIRLREIGIHQPIVLLEGVVRAADLNLARGYRLELVVHQLEQVEMLEQDDGNPFNVWLKVDSGMHRLGVSPDRALDSFERLRACSNTVRLMTHLANADDRDDPTTHQQLETFQTIAEQFAGETSIANSAGILGWPQSQSDWARPGIMLYGASPFTNSSAEEHELKPVMTLQSELIAVNLQMKEARVGYGGTYTCAEDMPVGVVSIGYGDGYPRHIKEGTPVLINGQRAPIIGKVSMDMLCVDLRKIPRATIGDKVTLWGEGLAVEEIAQQADTICYELLCQVTNRVSFIYA